MCFFHPNMHIFQSHQSHVPWFRVFEVDFMRALLCDYVGADRADQVAHKSYVPRQMAGFGWDTGIPMRIWFWYIDTHWTRITRILKLLGFSWEYDYDILSAIFWFVTNWLTIWVFFKHIVHYSTMWPFNIIQLWLDYKVGDGHATMTRFFFSGREFLRIPILEGSPHVNQQLVFTTCNNPAYGKIPLINGLLVVINGY